MCLILLLVIGQFLSAVCWYSTGGVLIDEEKFEVSMSLLVPQIIHLIFENYFIDEIKASSDFYKSKVYSGRMEVPSFGILVCLLYKLGCKKTCQACPEGR